MCVGSNSPLPHVVVSTYCNLLWWCFPSISWRKYFTCTLGCQYPLQHTLVTYKKMILPPPHNASCNMRISKCAGALRKTPPAQVAMATMSARGMFALVHGSKNTTSARCTVSRPTWAQVYRSGMQQPNACSTRARFALRWCPCAICIWLLHPAPYRPSRRQHSWSIELSFCLRLSRGNAYSHG